MLVPQKQFAIILTEVDTNVYIVKTCIEFTKYHSTLLLSLKVLSSLQVVYFTKGVEGVDLK